MHSLNPEINPESLKMRLERIMKLKAEINGNSVKGPLKHIT